MCWRYHRMLSEGYDDMTGLFILTLSPLSPLLPFWPVPPVSPCTKSKALAKKFKSNQWAHLLQTYRSFSELSTLSPSSPGGPEDPAAPGSPAGPGCPSRPAGPTGPFSPCRTNEKNINVILWWEVVFVYYNRLFHIFILLELASAICLIMTLLKARAHIFYYPVVESNAIVCDQKKISNFLQILLVRLFPPSAQQDPHFLAVLARQCCRLAQQDPSLLWHPGNERR